ncbi:MAG: VWA domain-containing protein [Bryobacterales bacterium]|nr:VWA domain-containing protein [Bryobacterales bacterium]
MKFLSILVAGILPVMAQQPAPANFKVDVKLVRLLVNVKDQQGKLVGSLDTKDFSVQDCGVPQTISVFERQTELPLSVAVLIDVSGSTGKDLRYETTSVEKFFKALLGEGNPKDAASLYSFNYDVTLLQNFTRKASSLSDNLRTLRPNGGTSLYDAIVLSARESAHRDGRHVIVIVTDGGDTTSRTKYADALEAAHLADAVIYPILVVPIPNDAGRNTGGEHALYTIAEGTGGHVFEPSVGAQLDQAFTDILRDLRTQYLLGYYPRNLPSDAPLFHTVHVDVARKDLRATTRTGYYGSNAR